MSYDETRAWYGGGYYEPPPPPPPEPTTEGGTPPPDFSTWLRSKADLAKGRTPPLEGDALVLGRFLPFHSGHALLINHAAASVKGKVHVCIAMWADDFIDYSARRISVIGTLPATRLAPTLWANQVGGRGEPVGDAFWAPWVEWFKAQKQCSTVRVLVSGEPSAKRFAELAGLQFELVSRDVVPVSGTAVRRAPWKWWDDIAPNLRPRFASSVALVGPEGGGKSTLASALGRHFQTSVAHEYLSDWIRGGEPETPSDYQLRGDVWNGQRGAWDAARNTARRFFIADTDQLTLALWAKRLYGTPIKTEPMRPGFTLLLDDATPWKGPKERDEPEARKQMVVEFRRLLTGRGWPFAFIDGPREERQAKAIEHIEKWIRSNPLER